jgi:23S rRNA pseudouridine2605 synthase
MSDSIKLGHFMAKAGVASRRACEALIRSGEVAVNGKLVITPAERIDPKTDMVRYQGYNLSIPERVYYLLHKPKGYTCTASDPTAKRLAVDLLEIPPGLRVFNVGRLDRDSEGLILFTNDGDFSDHIAHPRRGIDKEYVVHVQGDVNGKHLQRMEHGIRDRNELLKADKASLVRKRSNGAVIRIIISEGKNREVRRMCMGVGLQVRRLIRTRIGPLTMGKLNPGFNRPLTADEIQALWDAGKK